MFRIKESLYSSLAQSVEHAAVNRSVVGSSPTGGVLIIRRDPLAGGYLMMNANASAKQIYNAFAIPPTKRREPFS